MEVLYRKYRPQRFCEVTDQNHIRVTLQNQIESNKLGHAYLFCGPRGVSKTTIARILAKTVNCENRKPMETEPCNICQTCKDIVIGRSLDVIEIDAASHTGVDNVRENIIENSRFQPTRSKYKVYIIDEVHMLSTSAFNALLKTLEEPPAYVIFILVTTESHKIPATIISRCQRFDFKKINLNDIVSAMREIVIKEQRNVDNGVLESVARYADGGLRDALSMLDQILSLGDKNITLDQVELLLPPSYFDAVVEMVGYLTSRDISRGLTLINRLMEDGADILYFTDELIDFYRKLLISKISNNLNEFSLNVAEDTLKKVSGFLDNIKIEHIIVILNILLRKRNDVKVCKIAQLPVEIAVVEIGMIGQTVSVNYSEPLSRIESTRPMNVASLPTVGNTVDALAVDKSTVNMISMKQDVQAESSVLVTSNNTPITDDGDKKKALASISLEEIKNSWKNIINSFQEDYHSLSLLLQVGRPLAFSDNKLTIGFQFKLHQQRVNDMKNQSTLRARFFEMYGVNIQIDCIVSDQVMINVVPLEDMVVADVGGASCDPEVLSVLKEFGGQVV